jgi:hypothetical protein
VRWCAALLDLVDVTCCITAHQSQRCALLPLCAWQNAFTCRACACH